MENTVEKHFSLQKNFASVFLDKSLSFFKKSKIKNCSDLFHFVTSISSKNSRPTHTAQNKDHKY